MGNKTIGENIVQLGFVNNVALIPRLETSENSYSVGTLVVARRWPPRRRSSSCPRPTAASPRRGWRAESLCLGPAAGDARLLSEMGCK